MAWSKTYPIGTTNISASTVQLTSNWIAIEDSTDDEHAALDNALSGTHLYGRVSAMFSGTYATIAAISSPGTGALAYDTTHGVVRIYDGSSWKVVTSNTFARAHLYSNTAQAIPATAWTQAVLGEEAYDSLSIATNSSITVPAAGYYLVVGHATWPSEAVNSYQKACGIYVGATRKVTDTKYGKEERETEAVDIIYMAASSVVKLYVYHTYTSNISIAAANLILTRLS